MNKETRWRTGENIASKTKLKKWGCHGPIGQNKRNNRLEGGIMTLLLGQKTFLLPLTYTFLLNTC